MNQDNNQKMEWYEFDASSMPLGRLATKISSLLIGKHRVDYAPNKVLPVHVVVTNTDKIVVTGNKEVQKMYRKYSGYPGGLRERSLKEQRARDSRKIINDAVFGMLPKNKLRPVMMKHLKAYQGAEHPHMAQLNKKDSK